MKVITSLHQIQKKCLAIKRKGQSIAVVPTMGYLHEGHLSLVKVAHQKADVVVMTLFVNPTQFGPKEDFKKYPRDTKGDLLKAKENKVDLVFMPQMQSMYPKGFETYVEPGPTSRELCGQSRPTHFKGVLTIVSKLFLLTQPDYAIFGKKDFQQYAVIKRMVTDLNIPVKIIGVSTYREKDGLAMSSRNVYLNPQQRKSAVSLSRGLFKVKKEVQKGLFDVRKLMRILKQEINHEELVRLDYAACMDAETIQPLKKYKKGKTLFAVAAFVGKTRLIDNIVV